MTKLPLLWTTLTVLAAPFAALAEQSDEPPMFDPSFTESIPPIEIHGVGNVQYYDYGHDGLTQPGQTSSGTPTFQAYTFHLAMGTHPTTESRLFADCEWEDGKTPKCDQMFGTYRFADWAKLTAGRFINPIDIEGQLHYASIRKLVSRTFLSRSVIPGTWADVGAMLEGTVPTPGVQLRYAAALTNGLAGPSRGDRLYTDNNRNKMASFRLGLVPFPWLEVGGNYARENYDVNNEFGLSFLGAYLKLDYADLVQFRAEYMTSEVEQAAPLAAYSRYGYMAQASYKFLKGLPKVNFLEAVVRYDAFRPVKGAPCSNANVDRVAVGLNYSPFKHIIVKTEGNVTAEQCGPSLANNAFLAEAAIDF